MIRNYQQFVDTILSYFDIDNEVVELLRHDHTESVWHGVCILPSAKQPGFYQVQYFSEHQLFGDRQFRNIRHAIIAVFEQGFEVPAKGRYASVYRQVALAG